MYFDRNTSCTSSADQIVCYLHFMFPVFSIYHNCESLCQILELHGPSMLAVKAKIYGVLYKQSSSIAFDETSSYWSALKSA